MGSKTNFKTITIMKKEIAQLVLNSFVSNPTMIERAALMQERWNGINLDDIATPIIKRILVDVEGIQTFLTEKYPGINISQVHIEMSQQKFEPMVSFREEYPEMWTPKSGDRWWNSEYSLEAREGWYRWGKDWNGRTLGFVELGIPEELYQVEWL
jgi:hypothetical protein